MLKEEIKKILVENGCPANMIENMVEKIANLQPEIAHSFEQWVQDQSIIPDLEIEGLNFSILVQRYKMQPIGAFLSLDWLVREPKKASEAIKRGRK